MYKSTIVETSINFDNKIDMIAMKDVSDCIMLDTVANDEEDNIIYPKDYAIIDVENDRAQNPNYTVLVIVDVNGTKYKTGSESFMRAFLDIFKELEDVDEQWGLKVYGKPSRNYSGKKFLTCSIAR